MRAIMTSHTIQRFVSALMLCLSAVISSQGAPAEAAPFTSPWWSSHYTVTPSSNCDGYGITVTADSSWTSGDITYKNPMLRYGSTSYNKPLPYVDGPHEWEVSEEHHYRMYLKWELWRYGRLWGTTSALIYDQTLSKPDDCASHPTLPSSDGCPISKRYYMYTLKDENQPSTWQPYCYIISQNGFPSTTAQARVCSPTAEHTFRATEQVFAGWVSTDCRGTPKYGFSEWDSSWYRH
jgi:hypothetical protein